MDIWVKTTMDQYEHIIALADSCEELAKQCGVTPNAIRSNICNRRKMGHNCCYKKIVIDEEEGEKE